MRETLGPYELRGELGRGAMAVVWRAWDPKLEREVAIKEPVLPAGVDPATAADLAARFVREGKAAAALNHPGIVTIYAADVYDGRPAIVMEIIEGETLSSVLERGPLSAGAALAVLDQLLDAVGYAHVRSVVHRDIKPDNVFVTTDGRVKLADFGIAHVGTGAALTQAGTVMGTPGYMSPEQVTGQPVDSRADIFAIGVVAYEMLTGRNPFGATDGVAPTTVMYRIVHEGLPQLPAATIAGIPADIATVLAVATAKDPSQRFGDAQAFRSALQGGPITFGAVPGTSSVASAPWNQAAVAGITQKPSGPASWTPYAIVGAIGIVVIGLLFVFAGGGSGHAVAVAPPTDTSGQLAPGTGGTSGSAASPTAHDVAASSASASTENFDGSSYYPAAQAIDGRMATCWAEGVGGDGVGQWLEVTFGESTFLTAIRVVPGYNKSLSGWDRWWSNGRLKSVRFTYSDGTSSTFSFADKKGWQTFTLSSPKETSSVRMTILSAYPPRNVAHKAHDTSVSEMAFSGWAASEASN